MADEEESDTETLPTVYGVMIAFITGLLGYVLWVSLIFSILNFLNSAIWRIN